MNIIITGASSGIGYETALKLSTEPGNKVLAIARSEDKLMQLHERSKVLNPNSELIPFAFDIAHSDYKELDHLLGKLNEIDILINNAGLMIKKPFLELEEQDWTSIFSVNLFGPVKLIRKLSPYMGKIQTSHIVNISSMGGFQGSVKFPGLTAYAASKAALSNLTEVLAAEFQDKNIKVNCLAIGSVETSMLANTFPDYKAPLTASEMADFISDFSLQGYKYFNGKVLPVALSTP